MSDIKKFDWEWFKKYVDSYDPKIHGANIPDVIFKDMLYGLGVSIDNKEYRAADGYKKFRFFLYRWLQNQLMRNKN